MSNTLQQCYVHFPFINGTRNFFLEAIIVGPQQFIRCQFWKPTDSFEKFTKTLTIPQNGLIFLVLAVGSTPPELTTRGVFNLDQLFRIHLSNMFNLGLEAFCYMIRF